MSYDTLGEVSRKRSIALVDEFSFKVYFMIYLLVLLYSRLVLASISDPVVGPPFRCACQKQERRIVRAKPCNVYVMHPRYTSG